MIALVLGLAGGAFIPGAGWPAAALGQALALNEVDLASAQAAVEADQAVAARETSIGSARELQDPRFKRFALSEATVCEVMALRGELSVYDEHSYVIHAPNVDSEVPTAERPDGRSCIRSNELGLRMDEAVRTDGAPRTLVTGGSHLGAGNSSDMIPQ